MADEPKPLAAGDHGSYAELARRPLPAGLVIQCVPALVAILTRAEQLTGKPLTEEQVLKLRDANPAVVVEAVSAKAVEDGRGYADLDPADPWTAWRRHKKQAKMG